MSRYRKLTLISCATALAFGLAACSSSDKSPASAGGGDSGPTVEQQLTDLQQQVAALRQQLGLPADGNISNSITDLQTQLADLRKQLADRQKEQEEKDAMANAAKLNKLATSIGVVGDDLDAHVQAAASRAKPDSAEDAAAPYVISGWKGASWTTTANNSTTTAVVYNNQAAATSSTFNKRFTIIATGSENAGTVALTVANHGKLVGGISGLPTHPSHTGVSVGQTNGVRGTLAGASGTFLGVGGVAVVGLDGNGDLTWTGTLHFKPDSATATVSMPDTSYVNLGWWLVSDKDGMPTDVMVAGWGTGTTYDQENKMGALIGKATFNGIAVGKYTHKTINSISGGHFNADAKLVADFGDNTAHGTLTGTINNFMQDGKAFGEGWMIQLGAAATIVNEVLTFNPATGAEISSGAVIDTNNGAFGTFGNQKTFGTWNAMFVGNDRNDKMPSGVTGTFHVGQLSHPINMVGAFAASNQERDMPDQ